MHAWGRYWHYKWKVVYHDMNAQIKHVSILVNKAVLEPRVSPAFAITYFCNHCNIRFENTSKYVDTLTLFTKNLNQRSLTPRWPLTPCLLRSHVWLYPRIIVSKSHDNTSMYVDTVMNFAKYHIHTHTYILHTTYRMSDHIVSYWTQFRSLTELSSGETKTMKIVDIQKWGINWNSYEPAMLIRWTSDTQQNLETFWYSSNNFLLKHIYLKYPLLELWCFETIVMVVSSLILFCTGDFIIKAFAKWLLSHLNIYNFAHLCAQLLQTWCLVYANISSAHIPTKIRLYFGVLCWVKAFFMGEALSFEACLFVLGNYELNV